MTLTDYGESVMPLAVWGLEAKTLDPVGFQNSVRGADVRR